MSDALGRWPVRLTLPVQWGEMDAFHHVNNVHYLRWFETARIAYFAAVGVAIELSPAAPLRPILARSTIDYRAPVTFPDTVVVEATVKSFGTTSFVMGYRLSSQAQGKVVAEGEGVIVILVEGGLKAPLDEGLKARIRALEAEAAAAGGAIG